MSLRTPYISLICILLLIALMIIEQSEKTVMLEIPISTSLLISFGRARASAIRRETN